MNMLCKVLMLLVVTVLLSGCAGMLGANNEAYLRVICGEAAGIGRFFTGTGNSKSLRHSDPDYIFTEEDKKLLRDACPRDAEAQLINLLIAERERVQR